MWIGKTTPQPAPVVTHFITPTPEVHKDFTFSCARAKTIIATFGKNSVALQLSDGRSLNLPQTISGSGARYASSDESIVFWNKGTTAFLTEHGQETYSGCGIVSAP